MNIFFKEFGVLVLCGFSLQTLPASPDLDRLVARLDQIRIPVQGVTAMLEIRHPSKLSEPPQIFKTFTQVDGVDDRRATAALMVCSAPPKDAGKLLLFREGGCWFYDPKAKHPTRISAGQMWSQPMSSDSLNWRLASGFLAILFSREEIMCCDGVSRNCAVIEFVPATKDVSAPAKMRYWVDDSGRYWRVEHFTASGRLFKTIDNIRYERMAGGERVSGMRIQSGAEIVEVAISKMTIRASPQDWFEPDKLPLIKP